MTSSNVVLCAIGVVVAALNVATLRRLWASPIFERTQKIAQTILIWVVPGSVLAVRHLLREQRVRRSVDPTTGAAVMVPDGAWNYGIQSGTGHHGSFGGDHGQAGNAGTFGGDSGSGGDGGGGSGGSDGGSGGGDGGV